MHEITLDALPGDGDGLGNCMQTKLTADSNVSGNANVSTIKTDAVLIKPVGGTLAMLTNVGTLKEEPGPSMEKKLGTSKEEPGPAKDEEPGPAKDEPGPAKEEEPGPAKEEEPGPAKEEPGAGAALADGADVEHLEDKVQVVITEDKVAGAEQARRPSLHPI